MRRLTISDFKRAIRSQHGVDAQIIGGETAVMPKEGAAPVDVLVLIFQVLDHPAARRCYAWEMDGQAVSVLHTGSIDSPQAAVRSTLPTRLRLVAHGSVRSLARRGTE